MNDNEIENLWRSPRNQPSAFQIEEERRKFTARLRRRHFGFVAYFTFVITALTVFTAWLGFRWMEKGMLGPAVNGPALALLALPWAAALLFVRRYLQHRRRHPDYNASLATAMRAALDEKRTAIARATGILRLHAMTVPLLALCLWQLHSHGLARKNEVLSMALFFGAILLISTAWTGFVHLTRLRREAGGIEEMMKAGEGE
ncbi:MAG TPA: hypothetical protein VHM91_05300 [Verrucomicrobiales bacterium]|jgi:hypothetical protein|nr:hypothetical protein [Verrucomicrobiales bacterium]